MIFLLSGKKSHKHNKTDNFLVRLSLLKFYNDRYNY